AGLFAPVDFLRGPGAAAAAIVQGAPTRVLYAGSADGNFVFSVRARDPQLQVSVIRAWKLRPGAFEESTMDEFCQKYGIEWVAFENTLADPYWSKIRDGVRAAGKLEWSFPLQSTRARWRTGAVEVYRFAISQKPPSGVLPPPIDTPGG